MDNVCACILRSQEVLEKIREKVGQDPYANLLGVKLLELKEGYAKASVTVESQMANFHEVAHGGLIASLVDVTFCGC